MSSLVTFYALLKNNGIIWGPEPYNNPLNGHYTYGPLGSKIKLELEGFIRKLWDSHEYEEVICPLIYPKVTWLNSGHWNKFQDPVIYTNSGKCYRLDKIIEEYYSTVNFESLPIEEINKLVSKVEHKILSDGNFIYKSSFEYKNLMMKTWSGDNECALRPETATTTYLSFDDAYNYFGKTLPLKVYQIGKAFRNEVSARNNVLRCKEFTQAEAHIFVKESEKNDCPEYDNIKDELLPLLNYDTQAVELVKISDCGFKSKKYAWTVHMTYKEIFKTLFPAASIDKIRIRRHRDDEKAFYALDAYDIEININKNANNGWTEICGIHDRGNYDMKQHYPNVTDNIHILEIAVGIDRLLFCLLDEYFDVNNKSENKSILRLPYTISPIKVAVLPLVKNKPDIVRLSQDVYKLLNKHMIVKYDEKQSIGKRYLKQSMMGTVYCVTVDFQTLSDGTVTVRDRNTEKQTRIKCDDLLMWLLTQTI
jgi:glycyl-tRNA synthetase